MNSNNENNVAGIASRDPTQKEMNDMLSDPNNKDFADLIGNSPADASLAEEKSTGDLAHYCAQIQHFDATGLLQQRQQQQQVLANGMAAAALPPQGGVMMAMAPVAFPAYPMYQMLPAIQMPRAEDDPMPMPPLGHHPAESLAQHQAQANAIAAAAKAESDMIAAAEQPNEASDDEVAASKKKKTKKSTGGKRKADSSGEKIVRAPQRRFSVDGKEETFVRRDGQAAKTTNVPRAVEQLDPSTMTKVRAFVSCSEAARANAVNRTKMSRTCRKGGGTIGSFFYRYAAEASPTAITTTATASAAAASAAADTAADANEEEVVGGGGGGGEEEAAKPAAKKARIDLPSADILPSPITLPTAVPTRTRSQREMATAASALASLHQI